MTWLAWRQARAQVLLAAVATIVVVLLLAATSARTAALAGTDELSTALESLRLLGTGLIGVPAAVGAFWGAPLLARELEAGTHRLAWTQSVTRRRWLATRLAVVGLATAGLTAVFSAVFTWWSLPFDRSGNRVGTANFGQRGITPVAYAVFALVLGALLGAIMRRTLPAMAATLVTFFVARFVFQLTIRRHLVDPVTISIPSNTFGPQEGSAAGGAWILSSETVDAAGRTVHDPYVGSFGRAMADTCGITIDGASTQRERIACVKQLGLRDVVTAHPADHFWALQAWETVSFLAAAALLAGVTFWWVRTRTS